MGACGPSGKWLNWLIPSNPLWIVNFGICCSVHDTSYSFPSKKTRRTIDMEFLTCLLKQSDDFNIFRRYPARILAGIYYTRVMLYGSRAWKRARSKD